MTEYTKNKNTFDIMCPHCSTPQWEKGKTRLETAVGIDRRSNKTEYKCDVCGKKFRARAHISIAFSTYTLRGH